MDGLSAGRRPGAARFRRAARGAAVGILVLVTGCSGLLGGSPPERPDGSGEKAAPVGQRPAGQVPYWVDPGGTAARRLAELRRAGREEEAGLLERIAAQPVAEWIGADDPEGRTRELTEAAERADRTALLVLYNIPHRDCGQYSQGGAADGDAYRAWLGAVAEGIGDRSATVIVEPDALPHVLDGCTPGEFHEERYALLNETVRRLKDLPGTTVYLDAGNPSWIRDPGAMAGALRRAGADRADGFALNVSNYRTTGENVAYGRRLSALLGGKHFVIDTSRNGNGPADGAGDGGDAESWCNPPGRALGEAPTTDTGEELVDAYLWIKRPGESDGTCKGGPEAGAWWEKYALELARNAGE
ncbi:endoglucanase [Streptomyces carminius]|uniref:Glucanase n=1 Tax=Streptomyces carminius TaxID=2665496 RepID=A0A2M8LQ46_9ACTN|nr:glycoside hydrolase family 6 protein [Streptomyces carminius]PJE94084.1 endoglucanase [Streptomyces carminius]